MEPTKKTGEFSNPITEESHISINDALNLLNYVWNVIKRRKFIVLMTFAVTVVLGLVFVAITPRIYAVTTRILSYQSNIIPQLTTPEGRLRSATTPRAMAASELIRSRENMIAVIQDVNLVDRWKTNRRLIGRIIDSIRTVIAGPLTQEDYEAALIEMLETRFWVQIDDNVIIITVNWFDPESTFALADAFSKRFLAEQQSRELVEYNETIQMLQRKEQEAKKVLDAAFEEYIGKNKQTTITAPRQSPKEISEKQVKAPIRTVETTETVDDLKRKQLTEELKRLKAGIALKQQEITRLESTYDRRVTDAKNELASLQATLGPKHPDVVKASRYLQILSTPPPAIAELKAEEETLAKKIEDSQQALEMIEPISSTPPVRHKTVRKTESIVSISEPSQPANDGIDKLLEVYRKAEINYNTQAERLGNARIELEAAEVAFAYRFMITKPPVLPKRPIKPSLAKNIIASILAGLIIGVFLAVFADIRSGMIVESWQVSKILKVPVLGEIDEP